MACQVNLWEAAMARAEQKGVVLVERRRLRTQPESELQGAIKNELDTFP